MRSINPIVQAGFADSITDLLHTFEMFSTMYQLKSDKNDNLELQTLFIHLNCCFKTEKNKNQQNNVHLFGILYFHTIFKCILTIQNRYEETIV